MRTIYTKYYEDDDIGEAEAFFDVIDKKLTLITAWSLNDANYRDEYMGSLFNYLGVKIEQLPDKHKSAARKLVLDAFGID